MNMNLRMKIIVPVISILILSVIVISVINYINMRDTVYEIIDGEMQNTLNNLEAQISLTDETVDIVMEQMDEKNLALSRALAELVQEHAGLITEDVKIMMSKSSELEEVIKSGSDAISAYLRANAASLSEEDAASLNIIMEMESIMQRWAEMFDVSEVHVTDENGVLWWGNIPGFYGFDFSTVSQTVPFLKILEDPAYELAQAPEPNSANIMFQYSGVARTDAKGIVQVGISMEVIDDIKSALSIDKFTKNQKIGNNGYSFILDNGVIVSHPKMDLESERNKAQDVSNEQWYQNINSGSGQKYITIDGVKYYAGYRNVDNKILVAVLTESEINTHTARVRNRSVIFALIAVLGGTGIAFYLADLIGKPLSNAAKSLHVIGENINKAVHQFNESATILAESSNEQAASIEETSATMNETSSMIAQNAENTRQAADFAHKSKASTDSGTEKIREMVEAMDHLKELSRAISKIIKTIDEIAFQTNLLAINATVEAARAGGDAGRSFGVVAQEVRNLAQKSADSAAETAEIIEKNIALTNSGGRISGEVAEALESITNQFANLDNIIKEISEASEEQAMGVKQVNAALSQMEQATQSNAAISEESAASAKMLQELVQDLEKAYQDIELIIEGKKPNK